MTTKRRMRIGLSMRYLGYHDAAWRHPDVPAGGASDFAHFRHCAQVAEEGRLDMVFFADGIGVRANDEPPGSLSHSNRTVELEPLTLLSALAPVTRHVGLVCTASTTYNEPFHIARKFASLDRISGGRAGWNVVTSWSQQEAWNFSRDEHMGYAERYDRAREFVDVVTGLWESWEPDAFTRDKGTGQFYDPAKLHVLDHKGPHFRVRGPLSVEPTPQGRPILVQAGANEAGQEIAAANADVVYGAAGTIEAARAYYDSVKGRMGRYGRAPEHLLVMPALVPIVGRTEAEARAKLDRLQALIDPLVAMNRAHGLLGDLSGHDLDGPVPEPTGAAVRSIAYGWWERAQREGMTLRQMLAEYAIGEGFRLVGTPEQIADVMEEWVDGGAADGFNITPTHMPGGAEDFVALVLPELRRRGRFRTEYEADTLRGNLGLPPYVSRWAR